MTDTHSSPSPTPDHGEQRYRRHSSIPRKHRVTARFNDEELATLQAAAEAAALTLTGYCAVVAVAAARDEHSDLLAGLPSVEELGEMQRELYAARVAVNQARTNINQA